ncbi:hypothetical protein RND81_11G072300 [Saponaria officinalis]|uniref:Uncharacterized protein n=1 Tax=Saponaria officinalis TaxID=3572 RepID=A0AAW1HKJ8_SAPOF
MGSSERKKWLLALFTALTISIFLSISIISGLTRSPYSTLYGTSATVSPPSFGYYIHGGAGDKEQVMRLLLAVYHPRNRYLLHLVADASDEERDWLLEALMSVPAVQAFENVDASDEEGDWPGKPLWLTGMGATHLAATLRAVAILLKLDGGWDWFISLNAYDYPLLTQDGMSSLFRSLSFYGEYIFGNLHLAGFGYCQGYFLRLIFIVLISILVRFKKW